MSVIFLNRSGRNEGLVNKGHQNLFIFCQKTPITTKESPKYTGDAGRADFATNSYNLQKNWNHFWDQGILEEIQVLTIPQVQLIRNVKKSYFIHLESFFLHNYFSIVLQGSSSFQSLQKTLPKASVQTALMKVWRYVTKEFWRPLQNSKQIRCSRKPCSDGKRWILGK